MRNAFAVIMTMALVACTLGVAGCAHAPTQNERTTIAVLVPAAVAIVVQRETSDPAVWATRAALIINIANTLAPLADEENISLPALTAALAPVIERAHLSATEQIGANALIAALSQVIEANVDPDHPLAVTIKAVLSSVIEAATVYVPKT